MAIVVECGHQLKISPEVPYAKNDLLFGARYQRVPRDVVIANDSVIVEAGVFRRSDAASVTITDVGIVVSNSSY